MWKVNTPELEMTRRPTDTVYSPGRYQKPRKPYPWKNTDIGRWCLCLIYAHADNGTDHQHIHTPPKKLGITAEGLEAFIRKHCPEIFEEYEMATGNPLTGKILMSRFNNMYRDNRNKTFGIGPEHPINHSDLRPVLNEVQKYKMRYKAKHGSF